MQKIKVKIHGHSLTDPFGYSFFILSTLKKYYDVELSEEPDYLFYTDSMYDHYKYDCIKIYYTGENVSPNFNQCDYALSFDYLSFEDRHYRLPLYLVTVFYNNDELVIAGKDYLNKNTNLTKEELQKKKEFCSFVYSNYRSDIERKKMFELISSYKQVNSAGSYLNNTNGVKIKNKLKYEKNHKFVIAFENSSRSGYTTEKIVSALVAKTIPIYWGNPNIAKEFNTERFINCHDYTSFEEVLKKVKELDADDNLFLQMVNNPITAPGYNFNKAIQEFEDFIKNIVNQPLDKAIRRSTNPVQAIYNKKISAMIESYVKRQSLLLYITSRLYTPFKRIPFFEKLKQAYFRRNQN